MSLFFVCVKIFFARILDVTISTIRQNFMLKEHYVLSTVLAFFEIFIWFIIAREALLISMVRILLVSITFGNGSAFLYSMAGGILSFLVMWIFQKKDFLLPSGVSIAGGIAHNVGQLLMAAVILENGAVFTYFPVLLAAGCITGGIIGFLGEQIRKRIIRA